MSDFNSPVMITPPAYAKRIGVKPDKVVSWIRAGELRAIDVSEKPGTGKPRFRISEADISAFEESRTFQPPTKKRRRRRHRDEEFSKYFK